MMETTATGMILAGSTPATQAVGIVTKTTMTDHHCPWARRDQNEVIVSQTKKGPGGDRRKPTRPGYTAAEPGLAFAAS
jgi:hypothetical protein